MPASSYCWITVPIIDTIARIESRNRVSLTDLNIFHNGFIFLSVILKAGMLNIDYPFEAPHEFLIVSAYNTNYYKQQCPDYKGQNH